MTDDPSDDAPGAAGRWGERERRLLLVHIEHYWHNSGSSPSYTHLADVYRMGSGTIRHHCQQLAADGFLEIQRNEKGKTSAGRSIASVVLHLTVKGREEAYRAKWRRQMQT